MLSNNQKFDKENEKLQKKKSANPISGKRDNVKKIKNNDENNQNLEGQIGEIQMLEKKILI